MSWLTGLIQGLGTAGVGYMKGQAAGEAELYERQQAEREFQEKLRQQALADTLMGLKIDDARYQQGRRPIEEQQDAESHTAMQNYRAAQTRYQDSLASRPPKPERIDPLSPEGISASEKRAAAVARVAARYRKPTGADAAAENRTRKGKAILSTWGLGTSDQVRRFAQAFNALRAQGHEPEEAAFYAQEQVSAGLQEERRDAEEGRKNIRISRMSQSGGSSDERLLQALLDEDGDDEGAPPMAMTTSEDEVPSGVAAERAAAPAAQGDPALEQMRREWDQLAARFGRDVTEQQVGPRP